MFMPSHLIGNVGLETVCQHAAVHRYVSERMGCMPPDMVEALRAAGCFRFFVPSQYAGAERGLLEALSWLTAIAEVSGSIAWGAMVAMQTPFLLALMPPSTFRQLYAEGPDVLLASSSICAGLGVVRDSELEVSGYWPFVTGAEICTVFLGHVQMQDHRGQSSDSKRGVLIRKPHMRPVRQKLTMGLVGSNTVHMEVPPCRISLDESFVVGAPATPFGHIPEYRLPIRVHFAMHMAAVAIGVASAAIRHFLDGGVNQINEKRQYEWLARSDTLGAAIANVELQRHALCGFAKQALMPADAADVAITMDLIHAGAVEISQSCQRQVIELWKYSHSSVLYDENALQMCFRDMQTITKHANLSRSAAGALGQKALAAHALTRQTAFRS